MSELRIRIQGYCFPPPTVATSCFMTLFPREGHLTPSHPKRERHGERETYRHTGRERERERHIDTQGESHGERDIDTQGERVMERERHIDTQGERDIWRETYRERERKRDEQSRVVSPLHPARSLLTYI